MTPQTQRPAKVRSRDWAPFQPTEKKPGEWEQTPFGFRRLQS